MHTRHECKQECNTEISSQAYNVVPLAWKLCAWKFQQGLRRALFYVRPVCWTERTLYTLMEDGYDRVAELAGTHVPMWDGFLHVALQSSEPTLFDRNPQCSLRRHIHAKRRYLRIREVQNHQTWQISCTVATIQAQFEIDPLLVSRETTIMGEHFRRAAPLTVFIAKNFLSFLTTTRLLHWGFISRLEEEVSSKCEDSCSGGASEDMSSELVSWNFILLTSALIRSL